MGQAQFKISSLLTKWVDLRGLPTFLVFSIVLHVGIFSKFALHRTHQEIPQFDRSEFHSLQARIVRNAKVAPTQPEAATITDATSKDSPINGVAKTVTPKEQPVIDQIQNIPIVTPPVNQWQKNRQFDANQLQQIYLQQQKAAIHQQTSQQIQFLISQLTPEFSVDVICETKDNSLSCTPSISASNLNLLSAIQQQAKQQLYWQLTGNPFLIQFNGIKITLWL